MELKIEIRMGNNPNLVTVSAPIMPEVRIELRGEVDELMPFFDKMREDGITAQTMRE